MIRFLSPGAWWALAAPAAIVVLYLLRRRYLPRSVPSVFLWRRSVRDYAANRPFQRLMKNLLLPLQVLAALALALALMRPALPGGTAGRSIFIFDISGSMQTHYHNYYIDYFAVFGIFSFNYFYQFSKHGIIL